MVTRLTRQKASTCCSTRCRKCSSPAACDSSHLAAVSTTTSASCTPAGALPGARRVLQRLQRGARALHRSGADIFLMPSMYEPCGLNQMYSLKYGTVPIVRRTAAWQTRCATSTRPQARAPASSSTTSTRTACAGRSRPHSNGSAAERLASPGAERHARRFFLDTQGAEYERLYAELAGR